MLSTMDPKNLDALVNQLKNKFSHGDWDDIISISHKLIKTVDVIKKITDITGQDFDRSEKSFVYYLGFAYMAIGSAFQNKHLYEEASQWIKKYSFWSDSDFTSKEDEFWISHWQRIAEGNSIMNNLFLGIEDSLQKTIDYMHKYPNDSLAILITILEAANFTGINVDEALEKAPKNFLSMDASDGLINISFQYKFFYQFLLYQQKRNSLHFYLGIILKALSLSCKIGNVDDIITCNEFYESVKEYATPQQDKHYTRIIKGANKQHEKTHLIRTSCRRTT